jgi:Protein of unknown function (DUF2804)
MQSLPVRGPTVRDLSLALPPARMPLQRRGRPLKRWRYVGVYGPELMLCVAEARIAGVPQRWWAVALPGGTLHERTSAARIGIELGASAVRVTSDSNQGVPVSISLELGSGEAVEVVSPHGRSHIWTRKQAGIPVRGRVLAGEREWELDGPLGFVDESAGYHARHTRWLWSAGVGRAVSGEQVAWNLVDGVHDAPEASERTVWVDGRPHEVGPQPFAEDLSGVGELRFEEWCTREDHTRRLVLRSDYRQPFGSFSGTLPGGLELESGHGVMEWHDVRW